MEQILGVFGIDWRLLAFQIVNFVVLLLLLRHFLYKPVFKIIDERRDTIAEGVRNAASAKEKLQTAGEEAATTKAQAVREADALVESGKRHAAEREKAILEEA